MQDSLFKQYKNVFEEETEVPKEKGNFEYAYSPFALQDAVGERDIKKIWIEYEKLRFQGIEAEEIIHKIITKVRDMSAIAVGATKEDLSLKDYPYNKSKRDLKNWQISNLKNFYTELVTIYHGSRGALLNGYSNGRINELDTALEKTLLNI